MVRETKPQFPSSVFQFLDSILGFVHFGDREFGDQSDEDVVLISNKELELNHIPSLFIGPINTLFNGSDCLNKNHNLILFFWKKNDFLCTKKIFMFIFKLQYQLGIFLNI